MKCAEIKDYPDDYVGGELDFAVRRKVESHLHECAACRNETERQQNTVHLLKDLPLIAPSNQFDARMMQAFQKHRETKNQTSFWTAVFANFSISKPALGFALIALIVFTGAAFQLGRITSPNAQNPQTVSRFREANETQQIVKIVEKRIEIPVIKTVEVPVYKERIVNHVIYRNRDSFQKSGVKDSEKLPNLGSQNNIATFIQTSDESFTPLNLKDFHPVSEVKISIIKREENEK